MPLCSPLYMSTCVCLAVAPIARCGSEMCYPRGSPAAEQTRAMRACVRARPDAGVRHMSVQCMCCSARICAGRVVKNPRNIYVWVCLGLCVSFSRPGGYFLFFQVRGHVATRASDNIEIRHRQHMPRPSWAVVVDGVRVPGLRSILLFSLQGMIALANKIPEGKHPNIYGAHGAHLSEAPRSPGAET